MPKNLKNRSLLTLNEFTSPELVRLIDRAIDCKKLKQARIFNHGLKNRNICGIFLKPSGRTSTSFVVASHDEGAHLQFFPAENIRFGHKESVKDFARLVGRLFDGIAFRGFEHEVAEQLAEHAGIPVWNGLTDTHHPTQVLADVMTFKEEFGTIAGLTIAYLGDGRNNMVTSLAIGALKFGYHLRIVAPAELQPTKTMMAGINDNTPERLGSVTITDKVGDGVAGADVVYTDVWVSMGEKVPVEERIRLLKPYKVTPDVMKATGRANSIFMHCLPAFHDLETEVAREYPELIEVDDAVFEGPQSRVFDQAENRMHSIKALMLETI
ncbi:MAG: ornithine carbamoyltransferase [Brucellaceae bacterium]|nr:ornithine carbamoyltransferase [Brucellaceae bacterium]